MSNPVNRRSALGLLLATVAATDVSVAASTPAPKATGLITAEEVAALEFKEWDFADNEAALAAAHKGYDAIQDARPTFVVAFLSMCRTKAGLMEIVRGLNENDGDAEAEALVDRIIATKEMFREAASLMESAEIRLMSAYASVLNQDDPDGFAEA